MPYTERQLLFIREKRPELRLKPVPKLDDVVVAFLSKYEVFVQPPKNTNRRDGAIAGAITGMAGADVGGDAFLISGQNKQTKLQEWTSWKQWALDHKDFESFKFEMIDKAKQHNEDVKNKLEDPKFKKDLEPLLQQAREKEIEEEKLEAELMNFFRIVVGIFIFLFIGVVVLFNYEESKESSSSNLEKIYIESFK